MATAEQILAFRLLISQPDDTPPYDDASLGDRLDAAASSEALAGAIWMEKAASYAELVNVSESGSSRALGQLHANALAMAKSFGTVDPAADTNSGVRMKKLTRR